jgi:hypothetical protein
LEQDQEAKADGFYRLELSAPNCGIVKDLPIILSRVLTRDLLQLIILTRYLIQLDYKALEVFF